GGVGRATRSWMNTSAGPLVSPATRFEAEDKNATTLPSLLIDGFELAPLACAPKESILTRTVVPARRSCTNTSGTPFVSPGTRFVAFDEKATQRPSALIDESPLPAFAPQPAQPTLTP